MALVSFTSTQGGSVAVRTEDLFAAVDTAGAGVELWFDAPREVHAADSLAAVGGKLPGFVDAVAVAQPCLVNPARVVAVIPHPQNANVCFMQGLVRRIAVQGSLDEVVQRLGG